MPRPARKALDQLLVELCNEKPDLTKVRVLARALVDEEQVALDTECCAYCGESKRGREIQESHLSRFLGFSLE